MVVAAAAVVVVQAAVAEVWGVGKWSWSRHPAVEPSERFLCAETKKKEIKYSGDLTARSDQNMSAFETDPITDTNIGCWTF